MIDNKMIQGVRENQVGIIKQTKKNNQAYPIYTGKTKGKSYERRQGLGKVVTPYMNENKNQNYNECNIIT